MSHHCENPDCPTHGNTPRAKALRQAKQEILTNDELLSVVRILATNAHREFQSKIDPRSLDFLMSADLQRRILGAEYDADPIVQGLINGLTVLLVNGHEPAKVMVTQCAEIEAPYAVERITGIKPEDLADDPSDEFVDQFMAFIKGIR